MEMPQSSVEAHGCNAVFVAGGVGETAHFYCSISRREDAVMGVVQAPQGLDSIPENGWRLLRWAQREVHPLSGVFKAAHMKEGNYSSIKEILAHLGRAQPRNKFEATHVP